MRKTYQEKKNEIREKAIEYSLNIPGDLSYLEMANIQDYFYTTGKRYGLLKEFRENAIC